MDKNKKILSDISSIPNLNQPENVTELINKYGTYEIQPTAESDNFYPTIAQGKAKNNRSFKKS